ncbi:MAG TPA: YeeE/YedE thiosulfate transporter family protein [Myxococcales bacterium]|nr:YeeE/YedE thiosulfate transporter family protein [Myxococcales bacterium]
MSSISAALAGGALIGLAATLLLLLNGRVLGITGIVAGLAGRDVAWRALFLCGMILGAVGVVHLVPGSMDVGVRLRPAALVAGGLLVGFGTRMANGCTSGHGVCGVSRLSKRSLVATAVFMSAGALTVFLVRHVVGA